MTDTRVVRQGLGTQVYDALQQLVLNMELAPGSKLVIDQLAERIGVSATPVREALNRLAAERLIEFTPYRGFTVMPEPTAQELGASFEARQAIEEFSARLGCARASDEEIAELRRSADHVAAGKYGRTVNGYLEFLRRNRDFHERVVAAAANSYLSEAAKSLFHDAIVARTLRSRGVPDLSSIIDEHEQIVDAFERRDADAAAAAVGRHAVGGASRMMRFAWDAGEPAVVDGKS